MREHTVRAHTRELMAKIGKKTHNRLVRVRSYHRGNERPDTRSIITEKKPIDSHREQVGKLVDAKLGEAVERANANKGPYWKKIADFQLNLNGKNWRIVNSYDTGGYGDYEDCQLCGHKGCRYMYVISDGKENMTIGDECVGNYIKDLDSRDIFKKHNKRLRESIGKTKSYRDLLVDLLLWEERNGTNNFATNMKRKIMGGLSLSQNMVSALKKMISKDREKPVAPTGWDAKTDRELYNLAMSKPQNDWEKNKFMPSIGKQISMGWKLTGRQREFVIKIIENK